MTDKYLKALEIYPDLYIERKVEIIIRQAKEVLAIVVAFAMGACFFGFWLAYEGWITP